MKDNTQNPSYWIYLAGFYLIVLQILNVFSIWSIPHDWGKSISFRIIFSVLIFLFLWQIVSKKISISYLESKIKSSSVLIYLLLSLFFVYLLATIFSVNSHFSLWGDPNREGGFVNFSFYIFFAILAFLIIKKDDWRKIIDFSIIIGLIVCAIAIFQKFGIFSKYLIPVPDKPVSVMGNPILLSIYLLLMSFLPISFGIIEKNKIKKIIYIFSATLFFLMVFFLTQTRGTYLGFFVGFSFFFFFYPKKTKVFQGIKIYGALFLVLLILGMFSLKVYLDNNLYIYQKLPVSVSEPLDRALGLFEGTKITEARVSVWKISLDAFKEKPILGYGPENFVIAFDKYYDPSLPKIGQITPGDDLIEWFDRAHNFVFDIAIAGGVVALIIYISIFAVLIWYLQKIKYRDKEPEYNFNNSDTIIAHGLQATFLGYLTSLFSAFDSVSTYIIFFFLVGYALHLIGSINLQTKNELTNNKKLEIFSNNLYNYKIIIFSSLSVALVWFVWSYNLKPLYLNKEINIALFYSTLRQERACEKALNIIDRIYPSTQSSIINNYLGQKSTSIIYKCSDKLKNKKPEELVNQIIDIIDKNIEKNPQYVTNWILRGEYTGILIKEKNKETENVFVLTEETKRLKDEADFYFGKALQLSPRRQLILKDLADVNIATGEYRAAQENLQKCIDLNPSYSRCYWYLALNNGYQKKYEEFKKFLEIAKEKNYGVESPESLQELVNMYIRNNDYQGLSETYPRLITLTQDPLERAQLHASLAATYKELGEKEKAIQEVLKIKEIIPLLPKELQQTAEKDIENFLNILKQD